MAFITPSPSISVLVSRREQTGVLLLSSLFLHVAFVDRKIRSSEAARQRDASRQFSQIIDSGCIMPVTRIIMGKERVNLWSATADFQRLARTPYLGKRLQHIWLARARSRRASTELAEVSRACSKSHNFSLHYSSRMFVRPIRHKSVLNVPSRVR